MKKRNVWFVTGASKGLGLDLVKKLLSEGLSVAATSRNVTELINKIGNETTAFLPIEMNLMDENSVSSAVNKTLEKFGIIDVIVNNAGYGQLGTLEELSDKECRENFEVNVFGALNVIRKSMPILRIQKRGLIINIASIGALTGDFAGWGIYCATKFAMAGFTESLAAEIKEFGVNATVVYPGYFRTNFLSGGSLSTPADPIHSYSEARKLQKMHEESINGNQPGDPSKAAEALLKLSNMENPPLHLYLGSDAFHIAEKKFIEMKNELQEYQEISRSTDF